MIALIDADILCYSIGAYSNDHPFLKDEEGSPLKMPVREAEIQGLVDEKVKEIIESAGCTDCKLFITGDDNFRKVVSVTRPYKGHRKKVDRPYHYETVKRYLLEELNAIRVDTCEADDLLAVHQKDDTCICSLDKDLKMVPGWHYNWNTDIKRRVSEEEGYRWFMYQLLVGDGTDNIIGCGHDEEGVYGPRAKKAGQTYVRRKGIGPKQAESLLGEPIEKLLGIVRNAYEQEFGTEWEAKLNEMGALLHMGGDVDDYWNYRKQCDLEATGRYCFGPQLGDHFEDTPL